LHGCVVSSNDLIRMKSMVVIIKIKIYTKVLYLIVDIIVDVFLNILKVVTAKVRCFNNLPQVSIKCLIFVLPTIAIMTECFQYNIHIKSVCKTV